MPKYLITYGPTHYTITCIACGKSTAHTNGSPLPESDWCGCDGVKSPEVIMNHITEGMHDCITKTDAIRAAIWAATELARTRNEAALHLSEIASATLKQMM